MTNPEPDLSPSSESDLPEGWASTTIGEAFLLNPPKPPAHILSADTLVTFAPMPAVDADHGTLSVSSQRPYSEIRGGFTAFAENDVLMAKITPCMENGKAAIARGLQNGLGFGSTEFHVLRSIGVALPEYVFHFIRQKAFRALAEGEMTGSVGQKRVPADFLRTALLPLPPLAEQRRIVAKVEELLASVQTVRSRLARTTKLLKRFRQSVLAAACAGRLTADWRVENPDVEPASALLARILREKNPPRPPVPAHSSPPGGAKSQQKLAFMDETVLAPPVAGGGGGSENLTFNERVTADELPELPEEWCWVRLPNLGEFSRGRSRNRPRNAPSLYVGNYPFVQTGDIAQSHGRITQHKQTYSDLGLAQSRLWPTETVCITIAANIANSAILTYPACFPDSVVGLIADRRLCVPQYAEFFIRTAREDLSAYAPATAQKNINMEILNEVLVPFPPLAEQQEIVRRVERLFSLADAIERRVVDAAARADRLTQAVLANAFRGELVPTEAELARQEGREFEPASVLLERVRAERAAGSPRPSRGGREKIKAQSTPSQPSP